MHTSRPRSVPRWRALAAAAGLSLAVALTGCGAGTDAARADAAGTVTVGRFSNGAATETALRIAEVKSISAELPEEVARTGKLAIGLGGLPDGIAPLVFTGDDQRTATGAEPDLGRMVAAVLGLEAEVTNATWDNMFVGLDSGKVDVAFSSVTVTEERKKKYDFVAYRKDDLAFEVTKNSDWRFDDWHSLAGRTVAVGAGTNQEKILLGWKKKLAAEDEDLTVKYFPNNNSLYLALGGGRIDAHFGPNPTVAYHATQTAGTPNATRNAGTVSGAGDTLQGLIGATTAKGDGLAAPIAKAVQYLIDHGQYVSWLKAWHLSDEAVEKAETNPPGLPEGS
ncbi:transporter substrate-binding domain-containing protein [Streptomyces sp. SID12488]|uniref:transporter substrate-binding domain-containing protein n=1 Tax=Streptomyces sp. SID12488 TaxID=2706040 RepID=UPI0013DC5884|nr:transporter substrate-binding domain-containing protein [Streptomyces sp. SID12488]NEA67405.1 transporter substrate-binding domain-containing protein [Streptomyces sp. SID12488]